MHLDRVGGVLERPIDQRDGLSLGKTGGESEDLLALKAEPRDRLARQRPIRCGGVLVLVRLF